MTDLRTPSTGRGSLFGRARHAVRAATCLILLASALPGYSAATALPGVATNYVLVTNVVVVTNYVITTKVVLTTNAVAPGPTNSMLPDLSWVPPADSFDWIQLKSGEWLKGRLKAMQDRKLEFDSEKLELLTFDWKDIRQARSPRTLNVLSVNGEKVSGPNGG